jgi:hypothetical protein
MRKKGKVFTGSLDEDVKSMLQELSNHCCSDRNECSARSREVVGMVERFPRLRNSFLSSRFAHVFSGGVRKLIWPRSLKGIKGERLEASPGRMKA